MQSHCRRSLIIGSAGRCCVRVLVAIIFLFSFIQLVAADNDDDDDDIKNTDAQFETTEDPDATTQSTKVPTVPPRETEEENPALKEDKQTQHDEFGPEMTAKYKHISDGWKAPPIHEDPFKVQFYFENLEPTPDDPLNTSGVMTMQVVPRWAWRGAHHFKELIEDRFYENSWCYGVVDGVIEFGLHGGTPKQAYWDDHPIGVDQIPNNWDDAANTGLKRGVLTFGEDRFYRKTRLVLFYKDIGESGDTQLRPFAKVVEGIELLDRVHHTGKPPPDGDGIDMAKVIEQGDGYIKTNHPATTLIRNIVILGTTTTTTTDDISWKSPIVECETSQGNLLFEVHREWSTAHSDRFMELVRAGIFNANAIYHVEKDRYAKFGISPNKELREEWQGVAVAEDYSNDKGHCEEGQLAFTGKKGEKTTNVAIILQHDWEGCNIGKSPFVPFAELKGVESWEVIKRLNGEYGHLPDIKRIYEDGNQYLHNHFRRLDRITTCQILNDKEEWGYGASTVAPEEFGFTLGLRSVLIIVFVCFAAGVAGFFFCVMSGAMKEHGDEDLYKKV